MVNKYLQNTRKPEGFMGKLLLRGMNMGHAAFSAWAMQFLQCGDGAHVLDIGCGGGANIAKMLRELPRSTVDGIDYSEESVALSQRKNAAYLGKRSTITWGNVEALPYADGVLDAVTAFETVYFWPDLPAAFREVLRALKPGGVFLIGCEMDDPNDTTWTGRIADMKIYSGMQLKEVLGEAGFSSVEIHTAKKTWLCLRAVK